MIDNDDNGERQGSTVTAPVDLEIRRTTTGEGTAQELDSLSSTNLPFAAESTKQDQLLSWGAMFELNHLFYTQQWHKPYADALLEDDSTKLPALIAVAEQAILTRYLELNSSSVATDERLDLRHAVDALSQLKIRAHCSPAS